MHGALPPSPGCAVSTPGGAPAPVWHEVVAKLARDPVGGQQLILVTQTDVDSKVAVWRCDSSLTVIRQCRDIMVTL